MKKILFALVLLSFAAHFACKNTPFTRPVKFVAYVGFNYLNTAKDSANNYLDSLYIVTLTTYLERINKHEDPSPYPFEYQLKTFQSD